MIIREIFRVQIRVWKWTLYTAHHIKNSNHGIFRFHMGRLKYLHWHFWSLFLYTISRIYFKSRIVPVSSELSEKMTVPLWLPQQGSGTSGRHDGKAWISQTIRKRRLSIRFPHFWVRLFIVKVNCGLNRNAGELTFIRWEIDWGN